LAQGPCTPDTDAGSETCGVCNAGVVALGCSAACQVADAGECTGVMPDLSTDNNNCGGCGIVCATGTTCVSSQCTCDTVSTDLFAYYTFDGTFSDWTGNGNGATGVNVTSVPGVIGTAYSFNGSSTFNGSSNSSISLSSVAGTMTGARSLCAWVNPGVDAVAGGIPVFEAGSTGVGDFYALNTENAGVCGPANTPYIDHWNVACYEASSSTVPSGSWNYLCWTWDGLSTLTLYVDGQGTPQSGALYNYAYDTLYIGNNVTVGGSTHADFLGSIDEVGIWSCSLSATEVSGLYNSGSGMRP
jgi:hypothetical protein